MSAVKLGKISADGVAVFLCDIQEKFEKSISHFDDIVENSRRIVEATKILKIPLLVTEQYPKGLGKTVAQLDTSHAIGVFPKTQFTMLVPDVLDTLPKICDGRLKHVILMGIETHVCVQQTVIDLLEKGYQVHVVADAVSSRRPVDRQYALDRFRHSGAIVTTSEAILLQLIGGKDHPNFKEIQGLIKDAAPAAGL